MSPKFVIANALETDILMRLMLGNGAQKTLKHNFLLLE